MRRTHARFEAAGLGILAVGMGTPARSMEFRKEHNLPFPLLSDPRRDAYKLYGLLRLDFRRERSMSGTVALASAAIRYGGARTPDQDMAQLGGVFIVDTAGVIRYAHRARMMHDNPSPDDLLRAAAQLPHQSDPPPTPTA